LALRGAGGHSGAAGMTPARGHGYYRFA